MSLPTDSQERMELPLWTVFMGYFPDVFLEIVKVSVQGNKQHAIGEELKWVRNVSADHMNKAFRHQFDYGRGAKRDVDGHYHLAKAIWRLSAQLQLDIEEDHKAQQPAAAPAQQATPSWPDVYLNAVHAAMHQHVTFDQRTDPPSPPED